jgi:hypothetical protein
VYDTLQDAIPFGTILCFVFQSAVSHSKQVSHIDFTSGFIICDVLFPFLILPDSMPLIEYHFYCGQAHPFAIFYLADDWSRQICIIRDKKVCAWTDVLHRH